MHRSRNLTALSILILLGLPACRSTSTEDPGADSPNETTAKHTSEGESAPGSSVTTAEAREPKDDAWDPNTPVDRNDPRYKKKRAMFVRQPTSICPTMEEAKAEDCGNSVEFSEKGYKVGVGAVIHTIGESPEDGLWRSIRYMKPGLMPGWVRADRLAMEPDLSHQKKLIEDHRDRCEVASARNADGKIKAWQKSKKPCLVLTDVEPVEQTSDWKNDRDATFTLAVGEANLEVMFSAPDEAEMPARFLDIYEDGHMYRCDASYCDEVVYVLEKTSSKEEVELSFVADRYGLHPGK